MNNINFMALNNLRELRDNQNEYFVVVDGRRYSVEFQGSTYYGDLSEAQPAFVIKRESYFENAVIVPQKTFSVRYIDGIALDNQSLSNILDCEYFFGVAVLAMSQVIA